MEICYRYWWKGYGHDVEEYVKSCDKCQLWNRIAKTLAIMSLIVKQLYYYIIQMSDKWVGTKAQANY